MIPPNDKTKPRIDFELGVKEYASIGYVLVQWAFLEFALYERTLLLARRMRVPLPKDAKNFSFTRRVRVLRELLAIAIKSKSTKKRWNDLLARIDRAEGYRHRIAHGLWNYDARHPERLWTQGAVHKHKRAEPFEFKKLGEFAASVGELSFALLYPQPGSGRPASVKGQTVSYASRSLRLVMQGKDPRHLGLDPPISAIPERLRDALRAALREREPQ